MSIWTIQMKKSTQGFANAFVSDVNTTVWGICACLWAYPDKLTYRNWVKMFRVFFLLMWSKRCWKSRNMSLERKTHAVLGSLIIVIYFWCIWVSKCVCVRFTCSTRNLFPLLQRSTSFGKFDSFRHPARLEEDGATLVWIFYLFIFLIYTLINSSPCCRGEKKRAA